MPCLSLQSCKGSVALAQCKRALGKTWGLKPRICSWIYTGIIRPRLAYAALVWLPVVKKKTVFRKLERVQRLALLNLFGVMRSTPTAAIEVLVGMAPLDLYLQGVALKAMARTRQSRMWNDVLGPGLTNRVTHTQLCKRLSVEVPEMEFPCDHNTETLPSERLFSVTKRSRQEWETAGSPKRSTQVLSCFTDGSRLEERTGAAFFVNSEFMGQFPLGDHPSVYQAEVLAIIKIADALAEAQTVNLPINIYVDSLSALQSLVSLLPVTELVRECFCALNNLCNKCQVSLHWIPAHCGYSGNERVDGLAKQAALMPFVGPQPSIPISTQKIGTAITSWVKELHSSWWQRRSDIRL
jgi:ribonuclease HI